MEKYRGKAEERLANAEGRGRHKVHADTMAQTALREGEFASREREDFFTAAYGDILVDYFMQWLNTEPHEVKTREFYYNCAMGLGDVKTRLAEKEMLAKNIPYLTGDNNVK